MPGRKKIIDAFERAEGISERSIEKTMKKFFSDQGKRIQKGFKIVTEKKQDEDPAKIAAEITDQIVNWDLEQQLLGQAMLTEYLKAYELGAEVTNKIFDLGLDDEKLRGIINEDAFQYIRTKGAKQVKRITDTTRRDIKDAIEKGLREGETNAQIADRIQSTTEIADRIQSTTEIATTNRAKIIARTESHNTIMDADFKTIKGAGIKKKKWLTVGDEDVRGNKPTDKADHVKLNGQIRSIDKAFSNGLMYPGDPTGPPEEVIQCRCVLVPEI